MVCVQVKLNKEENKWEVNAPDPSKPENFGCASTNGWDPPLYARILPVKRNSHTGDNMNFKSNPNFDQIIVHVRHADDPFLYIEAMTKDTLDFGSASADMKNVGGVVFVIGALLGIQPCFLIYILCKKTDDDQRRLRRYERVMSSTVDEYDDRDIGNDEWERKEEDEGDAVGLVARKGGGFSGCNEGEGDEWVDEGDIELNIVESEECT